MLSSVQEGMTPHSTQSKSQRTEEMEQEHRSQRVTAPPMNCEGHVSLSSSVKWEHATYFPVGLRVSKGMGTFSLALCG